MYMDNFTLIFMNIMQPISENYKKNRGDTK